MKTNKNLTIEIDLVRRICDKLKTGQTFSGLVESLLEKWDKAESKRALDAK